ncbi:MAG: DUF3916 domain-containing protein [Rhodospirillaceae bacterium]|nr:DUF3916 domain-containing protein [Rhodospirillaceae bacterium]
MESHSGATEGCGQRPSGDPGGPRTVDRWVCELRDRIPDGRECSYWQHELPIEDWLNAIGGPVSGRLRRCAQIAVEAAHGLAQAKPSFGGAARALLILPIPHMAGAQISIIFDEQHYRCLTSQHLHRRLWSPLPPARSLCREWALSLPCGFAERGFADQARSHGDDGAVGCDGEVWLIGEV